MRPPTTVHRPGRNDFCPCGSGRKFKLCCGAESHVAAWQNNTLRLGSLTDAGRVRETAERFRQIQSGPPAVLFVEKRTELGKTPPGQQIAAERHQALGKRLLKAGKFPAAIAALRQAVQLEPENAGSHHALGRAFLDCGRFGEAVDSLRLAVTLNNDSAPAHCDLAVALNGLGQRGEAVAACRRSIALAPQVVEGHRLLGELLEAGGDMGEAAKRFRRAAELAPETAAGRLDLIRALLVEGNFPRADADLRAAIALDPSNDELYKILGQVLAAQGRFDEAVEACDQALGLNPLQVPAHLTAVRVRKCTEADRPRLARILAALRDTAVGDEHRLFLHFAAGKLLDDLGEYREAMRHFEMANGIRGRNARFDRTGLAQVIDWLVARFTADFFAANQAFGLGDETPILIVGMPRSGTTLIEQIVSSHPEIAAGEELFFWFNRTRSRGIMEATSLSLQAGRELAGEYLSLLRRIGPSAARVTDKQPFNFQQLGLIHLLLPNTRVIHCRRHPIDTCLSMYFTHFKGRMPFVSNKADLAFAYRQYARIMDHWRSVLPSDRFLEVDYEELVTDREAVTRKMIAFSGLGWDAACLHPERNERTVKTASLWQARQPVFATSVQRWRRYEPWLGEFRQLLPLRTVPDNIQ